VDAEWGKKQPEQVVMASQAIRFVLVQAVLERLAPDNADQSDDTSEEQVAFVRNGNVILSVNHLRAMECFHEALEGVSDVCSAIAWLRRVKVSKEPLPFPFNNITDRVNKVSSGHV
jgi:hypothetical protein